MGLHATIHPVNVLRENKDFSKAKIKIKYIL
jgi:hypothetical protein